MKALGHDPAEGEAMYRRLGADPEHGVPIVALHPGL
jgi:hypothetical protein